MECFPDTTDATPLPAEDIPVVAFDFDAHDARQQHAGDDDVAVMVRLGMPILTLNPTMTVVRRSRAQRV